MIMCDRMNVTNVVEERMSVGAEWVYAVNHIRPAKVVILLCSRCSR